MSFTEKVIGPDEKLIGVARVHWIYGAKGLLWLVALIALGAFLQTKATFYGAHWRVPALTIIGQYALYVGLVMGGLLFLFYSLMMLSTEIGLTTKRIVYKTGFIFVDIKEEDLEEIKGASVDNGFLGRFLNYGYVSLDARFISDVKFPAIADPYRYVKAVNEAKSEQKQDSMQIVLEGVGGAAPRVKTGSSKSSPRKHRQLHDERYRSMEKSPAQSGQSVMAEARENLFQQAPPDNSPDMAQRTGASGDPVVNNSEEDKPLSNRPTIFNPDVVKNVLRRKIKNTFLRTSAGLRR